MPWATTNLSRKIGRAIFGSVASAEKPLGSGRAGSGGQGKQITHEARACVHPRLTVR